MVNLAPHQDVLTAVERTFGPIEQTINTHCSHVFILTNDQVVKIPQTALPSGLSRRTFAADTQYMAKYGDQSGFMPLLESGEFLILPEQESQYLLMPRLTPVPNGLPLDQRLDVMQQAAQRLDTMHEQGDVYRDFRLGQGYLTPEGIFILGDYGLTCPIGAQGIRAGDEEIIRRGNLATDTTIFRDAFGWGMELKDMLGIFPSGDAYGRVIQLAAVCTSKRTYDAMDFGDKRPMQYVAGEVAEIREELAI